MVTDQDKCKYEIEHPHIPKLVYLCQIINKGDKILIAIEKGLI